MPVEVALNQRQNERSEVNGEAPQALPVEGATRAPVIARPVLFLLFDN